MTYEDIVDIIISMGLTKSYLDQSGSLSEEDKKLLEWIDSATTALNEHLLQPYLNFCKAYRLYCSRNNKDCFLDKTGKPVQNKFDSNISSNFEEEGLALGVGLAIGGVLDTIALSEEELRGLENLS